jgi:signal transduction histidine kinase
MLGCGEDLKSHLMKIENILPDNDKNIIKHYLEHITNLSSFIGYLIKGLTNKDINNVNTIKFKKIQLNSLLKFCYDILETLLSCDEQKTKNVKTSLKNLVQNEDVYFKSDEIQVKQILLNFISNSVKFTNYGKIVISAKFKKKGRRNLILTKFLKFK